MRVVLLTNDAASRAAAAGEGVEALHLAAYAKERAGGHPELLDLVARAEMEEDDGGRFLGEVFGGRRRGGGLGWGGVMRG
jgi:hypothetical protein